MTKQDPLAKQLETLFSDIVLPDPDVRAQRLAAHTATAILTAPTLVSMPQPAGAARPRLPERRTSLPWVLASLTVLAVAVVLGLLLIGPAGLEQQSQKPESNHEAAAANARHGLSVLSVAESAVVGGGFRATHVTSSVAITWTATAAASPTPAQVIVTPLTRPMTLTISVAGLPPTSEPTSLPVRNDGNVDAPTASVSAIEAEPPPTIESTATATRGSDTSPTPIDVVHTSQPETTTEATAAPTHAVAPDPTATQVQIDPPTPTILPSPTPVVLEQPPPTPTFPPPPQPAPSTPDRLVIPAINLDAPIITVGYVNYTINGQSATTFAVPERFAVGWHHTSAPPGYPGNTVLNGHQMINGGVFRDLEALGQNDEIVIYSGTAAHHYRVAEQHLLAEEGQPLSVRVENARWIMPTGDERLTLVTCAPYGKSSHRLVIVARPSSPSP